MNIATNPNPKARFQAMTGATKEHNDLITSSAFQTAEDFTLLEYARKLTMRLGSEQGPGRQLLAMENANKMAGVHEFLSEFRDLGKIQVASEKPGVGRVLNHSAQ